MTFEPVRPLTGYVPTDELVIEDLETLKVMADPLRLRIRELMTTPCTVKQIAGMLDIPATKLYYHINLLEKHRLIVVVDAKIVSGIIERHYQVAARTIRVSPHLLAGADENAESIDLSINTLFEDTRTDLFSSIKDGAVDLDENAVAHCGAKLTAMRLRLTDKQAQALFTEMNDLLERFTQQSNDNRARGMVNTRIYKAFNALFPTSRPDRARDEGEGDM